MLCSIIHKNNSNNDSLVVTGGNIKFIPIPAIKNAIIYEIPYFIEPIIFISLTLSNRITSFIPALKWTCGSSDLSPGIYDILLFI